MTGPQHPDLSAFLDMNPAPPNLYGQDRTGLTPSMMPSLSSTSMGNDNISSLLDVNTAHFDLDHIPSGNTPLFGMPPPTMADAGFPTDGTMGTASDFCDPLSSARPFGSFDQQPSALQTWVDSMPMDYGSPASHSQQGVQPDALRASQGALGMSPYSLASNMQLDQPMVDPTMYHPTDSDYHQRILQYHRNLAQNRIGPQPLPSAPGLVHGYAAGTSEAQPALSLQERRRQKRLQQQAARHRYSALSPIPAAPQQKRSASSTGFTPDFHPPPHSRTRTMTSQSASPVQSSLSQLSADSRLSDDRWWRDSMADKGGMRGAADGAGIGSTSKTANVSQRLMQHPYSSSGFDVLKALINVASRPNPIVSIGPVDQSCSFTIVDAELPDQPIVFCSDTFCRLTGYEAHEVLGRNCRFLQSPRGLVQKGSERHATDQQAVQHLAKFLSQQKECQASLINYRKDGHPFINLVTIVPITWDGSEKIKYFVGFQIDLVEQPGSIVEKMPDGSYFVNYSSLAPGSLTAQPSQPLPSNKSLETATADLGPEALALEHRLKNAENVSQAVNGKLEAPGWASLVLDNAQDLIFVLSLKGTVFYVSPSVEHILGFKPIDLIGCSIADFTHPSDVVPVFRELKDSTSNASIAASARATTHRGGRTMRDAAPAVKLLFRMRCKNNSYRWIESSGKLHLEQGKGRKVVVSSGRPRPVYHLADDIMVRMASTQLGFWARVSTDGLFLNVLAPVANVLRLTPGALMGKKLKELCETEAIAPLQQALRTAHPSAVLHTLPSGDGKRMQVVSSLYPSPMIEHDIPHASPHVSVWVHISRATAKQVADLPSNVILFPDKTANCNTDDGNVFAEMGALRGSSWCYELHLLQNTNRRLKEDLRATHKKRLSSRLGSLASIDLPSPSSGRRNRRSTKNAQLSDSAIHDMLYSSLRPQSGEHGPFAPLMSKSKRSNRSSSDDSGGDSRSSGTGSGSGIGSGSGSGSGTRSTLSSNLAREGSQSTSATSALPMEDPCKSDDALTPCGARRPYDMTSGPEGSSKSFSLLLGSNCNTPPPLSTSAASPSVAPSCSRDTSASGSGSGSGSGNAR